MSALVAMMKDFPVSENPQARISTAPSSPMQIESFDAGAVKNTLVFGHCRA
jgi:hypothetical protein